MFTESDRVRIAARGLTEDKLQDQLEKARTGFSSLRLVRACRPLDGIALVEDGEKPALIKLYDAAAARGRFLKFVPASGAASRMFKSLLAVYGLAGTPARFRSFDELCQSSNADDQAAVRFFREVRKFAFYPELAEICRTNGLDPYAIESGKSYPKVLELLLTSKGLDYGRLPKALILFHATPEGPRTAVEEHLAEAVQYVRDDEGRVRVHFTLPDEYAGQFKKHVERAMISWRDHGVRFEVTYSVQKPSTEMLALGEDGLPVRDSKGELVFYPAGHGALIENLNDLQGDLIFIKNIDNVVPDRKKPEVCETEKWLGGYLVKVQSEIFDWLKRLHSNAVTDALLSEAFAFVEKRLMIVLPPSVRHASRDDRTNFLIRKLNRPLRICGMVKNLGEPGGGPFWVESKDGVPSLQIVEKSQVDEKCAGQREILERATHFNPVDMVCAVRDWKGNPFDLSRYVNPEAGLITVKSREGRDVKVLELPGLWNGAMSDWNTLFVEIPLAVFNPVKSVHDLLRKEHQP